MKVLLAVDSSGPSQPVVNEALSRPWSKDTEFAAVHVVDVYGLTRLPGFVEQERRYGLAILDAVARRLCGAGYDLTREILLGFPGREIAEYARRWNADLVMVGSYGDSAIARFLLGSVAQGVLRSAPCSVEIVRLDASGSALSSHSMKILLATDGLEYSNAAARSVAARVWPAGSEVRILSVEELPPALPNQMTASSLSALYPPTLLDELTVVAHATAQRAYESARDLLRTSSLKVIDDAFTPLGDPRLTILEEAKAWNANLIVLGAHGRRGLDRMLLGSVSESVAMHAHCSVEVIRMPTT
jgi:nucleotide-binding universal stress UspA family protein